MSLFATLDVVPCQRSAQVFDMLASRAVDCAVLPVENTLHGSVAEHYDLLLECPVRLIGEALVHVRHNVIAAPGVVLADVRRVLSHPVALSQCRRWLGAHPEIAAEAFYDTAGGVKVVMERADRTSGAIAPALAAEVYGGDVLVADIQDHEANYTRFHVIEQADSQRGGTASTSDNDSGRPVDKLSVAFALEHRPGTLVRALGELASVGVDLTRIESRPVHGRPWEYIFFADMRCGDAHQADAALRALQSVSSRLRELGRYRAAEHIIP